MIGITDGRLFEGAPNLNEFACTGFLVGTGVARRHRAPPLRALNDAVESVSDASNPDDEALRHHVDEFWRGSALPHEIHRPTAGNGRPT